MRRQDAKKTEGKVRLIKLSFQKAVFMCRGGALYKYPNKLGGEIEKK